MNLPNNQPMAEEKATDAISMVTNSLPDGGRILPLLSPKQMETMEFIYDFSLKKRDYPTGTEIAEALGGVTKQAVQSTLVTLIKKGYLYRDRSIAERNIRLTSVALEKMSLSKGDMFRKT